MTPREFYRELVALKERREETHDQTMTLAWSIAAMTRGTKGLPKLASLLSHKPTRRQTVDEQVAMWQLIATRFGGQFTPMKETH